MKRSEPMQPADVIDRLGLIPHPEGGWYREVFRSSSKVDTTRGGRCAVTTIYYLLERNQASRWHRVESDEIWHFYEGAPLELFAYDPATQKLARHRLEPPSLTAPGSPYGEPVAVIPAGVWQAARSLGDHSLVGCSVGPGFEFGDFQFVSALPGHASHFAETLADLRDLL